MSESTDYDRLVTALEESCEGIDTALAMVEQGNFIPDWDWLRGVRTRARAALKLACEGR